jgi:hypothetical protein
MFHIKKKFEFILTQMENKMLRNRNLEQLLKHYQNNDYVKYFVYFIVIILSLFIFLGTYLKYNDKILTHYSENIDNQYPSDEMFCNSEKVSLILSN